MTVVWLKTAHIIALSLWCAGLLSAPFMLARREIGATGEALYSIQKVTRFVFVSIVSPAAFIAIGTGTALIFAMQTFTAWFALKLLLVGLLAKLHIRVGTAVIDVFKEGNHLGAVRMAAIVVAGIAIVSCILIVVLWKPSLGFLALPEWLVRPGGLSEVLGLDHLSSEIRMPTP